MNDLTYIQTNFLDQNQLCEITNISLEKLDELIKEELVPNPSYIIENQHVITSALDDKIEVFDVKQYFPKSTIALVEQNIQIKRLEVKDKMKSAYIQAVLDNDTNKRLCQNEDELNELFETRWEYYVKGIYGICTLNSTAEEIAKKEIVVQELINFIENEQQLSNEEKQQVLKSLNTDYNEVATLFAPFQRKKSSRGKYVDNQLKKHQLEKFIKKY